MNKLLVTGSSGLIGSEVVDYFCKAGDRPNTIRLKELPIRWEYDDQAYANGIAEDKRRGAARRSE